MALPEVNLRALLEAGVHFGHQAHRWNPKMAQFIFGTRNNIHILDLSQTVPLLNAALVQVSDTVAKGGRVLFVGTKRQAQEQVADAAKRSAQYYVNSRWLGGMLTNWKTISNSIARLRKLEEVLSGEGDGKGFTKKERLTLSREKEKLDRALGGIRDMGGLPDLLFVIDQRPFRTALNEAEATLEVARSTLTFADAQFKRADALVKSGSQAIQTLDDRRRELASAEANVRGAEASDERARLDLEYTSITAPIAGRVDRRLLSTGSLVQADQTVLTTIVWAAVGTAIAIFIAKLLTGLRVKPEVEQEGLDIGEHGERAYN